MEKKRSAQERERSQAEIRSDTALVITRKGSYVAAEELHVRFIQLSLILSQDLRASITAHSPLTETDGSDQDFPVTDGQFPLPLTKRAAAQNETEGG